MLDPAAGTGNLLYTVMNSIGNELTATAVEIDDLLVRLSAVTAELSNNLSHFTYRMHFDRYLSTLSI